MASTTAAAKTIAIQESLAELLDPSAPGNRVERSIRETLFKALTPIERSEVLDMMAQQGYDRAEIATKINELEEDYFGRSGNHA